MVQIGLTDNPNPNTPFRQLLQPCVNPNLTQLDYAVYESHMLIHLCSVRFLRRLLNKPLSLSTQA